MESLALAASLIMAAIILVNIAAVAASLVRARVPAMLFGAAAILAGAWLLSTLGGSFAIVSIACGSFAVARALMP